MGREYGDHATGHQRPPPSAAQKRAEAVLLKMLIEGQGFDQTALLHDQERGTVGQAPLLVRTVAVEGERLAKELAVLGNQFDALAARDGISEIDRGLPQRCPVRR